MLSDLATAIQVSIRQNYDLTIKSVTPIGTGVMSTTMRLATNRETLFLKIYKSVRNQKTPANPTFNESPSRTPSKIFCIRKGFLFLGCCRTTVEKRSACATVP